jgi:hypothetical protein
VRRRDGGDCRPNHIRGDDLFRHSPITFQRVEIAEREVGRLTRFTGCRSYRPAPACPAAPRPSSPGPSPARGVPRTTDLRQSRGRIAQCVIGAATTGRVALHRAPRRSSDL